MSLAAPLPASADFEVRFIEGAPKDMFTILNHGDCPLTGRLLINLATAPAGLVFDTAADGSGQGMSQPFALVEGEEWLSGLPELLDGQRNVELDIVALPHGHLIAFTTDVDDTAGFRAKTVEGTEIEGAIALLSDSARRHDALFDRQATALVPHRNCTP